MRDPIDILTLNKFTQSRSLFPNKFAREILKIHLTRTKNQS